MNRTIKKAGMIFVIVSLIALLMLGAVFFGSKQRNNNSGDFTNNGLNNPIEIGNYANVNGYVENFSAIGTRIENQQQLWDFIISGENEGYLANSFAIDDSVFLPGNPNGDSQTTANCRQTLHIAKEKILDGNGFDITINTTSQNLGTGWSNLTPTWKSLAGGSAMVVQGGLAAWNSGTIKNINFVIPQLETGQETIEKNHGASVVCGGVFGLNDGTIENCSLKYTADRMYKIFTNVNSKDNWDASGVAVGCFVGAMGGQGSIKNSKIDMSGNLSLWTGQQDGKNNDKTHPRGYAGGMVGWMSNANLTNVTIVGEGNVLSTAISWGYRTGAAWDYRYDYASYAGGLVGSAAKNQRMSNSDSYGRINGVVSSWKGTTQGTRGGDPQTTDYHIDADSNPDTCMLSGLSGRGKSTTIFVTNNNLFGAIGDGGSDGGGATAERGVHNITFLGMEIPARISTCDWTTNALVGGIQVLPSNKASVTLPKNGETILGSCFVGYIGDENSPLTISYDAPFVDTNKDGIDDFNSFVWSGAISDLTGENMFDQVSKNNYLTAKSIEDFTKKTTGMTSFTHTITRTLSGLNIGATFEAGRGAYIGAASGQNLVKEEGMEVYDFPEKTYDGVSLTLPIVDFTFDQAHALNNFAVNNADLWSSYEGTATGIKTPLSTTINAGQWTSVVQQVKYYGTANAHILFDVALADGYKYVGYAKDNESSPQVKQTVNQKTVSATYTINPSSFTYDGKAALYTGVVSSDQLLGADITTVQFKFFELAGDVENSVIEAKNVGNYRVKMSGLTNKNYKLSSENATDFSIEKRTIRIIINQDRFVYNGKSQTPTVDVGFVGGQIGDPNIVVRGAVNAADISYAFATAGLDDPSDVTQKNAGQFYVNFSIASGNAQRNYESLAEEQKQYLFSIERADCTINAELSQLKTYNGATQLIVYSVDGVSIDGVPEKLSGDVSYTIGGKNKKPNFAGDYTATITVSGGKGDIAPNYKSAEKEVAFKISPLGATITFDPSLAKSVEYTGSVLDYGKTTLGGIIQNGADDVNCIVENYTYQMKNASGAYEVVDSAQEIGAYKIIANFNGWGNYELQKGSNEFEFEITKVAISLQSVANSKEFGAENPDLAMAWKYADGSKHFVESDGIVLTIGATAERYSNVGNYAIVILEVNGANTGSYDIVLEGNTNFQVVPRQVNFDFSFDGMNEQNAVIYSGKLTEIVEKITYPVEGYLENAETALKYNVVFTNANEPGEAKNVGSYTVTISLADGMSNFVFNAESRLGMDFSIIARDVVLEFVDANDVALIYGDDAPVFGEDGYKYADGSLTFVNEDSVVVSYDVNYEKFNSVGEYKVSLISSANSLVENYNVTYPTQKIVVSAKTLDIDVTFNQTNVFDGAAKTATPTLKGIVNDDTVACGVKYNSEANAPLNAGTYALEFDLTNNENGNYVIGVVSHTEMVVNPKAIIPSVQNPSNLKYDATEKIPTITFDGLVEADLNTEVVLSFVFDGVSVEKAINAGLYTFSFSLPENIKGNYTFENILQEMEITPISVNVVLTAPSNVNYDGLEKVPTYVLGEGVIADEDVQVVISYLRNGNSVDKAIAYGDYSTVVSFGNTNYVVGDINDCVFTISTAIITADVTLPTDLVYSATGKVVNVVLNGINANDEGKVVAIVKYNGQDSAINVGAYTVEITLGGEAGGNYVFETITKNFTIVAKEIVAKFTMPTNLVFDGSEKVVGVEFTGVQGTDKINYTLTYNDQTQAINANSYNVKVVIDSANYVLGGETSVVMVISKADRTINLADFAAQINYNKLTITNNSGVDVVYNLNGGNWQTENVFADGIKALTSYTINIMLSGDGNYNDSNIVAVANLKTGGDPTVVSAMLDEISSTFGFGDIANYREALDLYNKVAEQDRAAIKNKMASATSAYEEFVSYVEDIVRNAQNNASIASGKPNGAMTQTSFEFANENTAVALAIVLVCMVAVVAIGATALTLKKKNGGNKNEKD